VDCTFVDGEDVPVKRLLLLLGAVAAVATAYRRRQTDRSEAELWAEATNPPDLR